MNSKRREFLRTLVINGLACPLTAAGVLLFTRDALAKQGAAPRSVDPESVLAKALGYRCDASKVDVSKFPKRKGPDGKTQFCRNCQLYTPISADQGTCSIFPVGENRVCAGGWCNSWMKKSG